MRTLIFGAKGQLGRDLMEVFASVGPLAGHDLPELDISDDRQVAEAIADFCPELIVNAAAYTDVEGAEDDAPNAFRVNADGAKVVARVANAVGAPVVYYSTDYVFSGGQRTPYTEDDPQSPAGVYARSKAEGEKRVREEAPRHFILRTAWLYGPSGNCFPNKMIALARRHAELKVVEDEIGSPTHTWDLAEASLAIVQTQAFGTYHAVNAGQCSRYELAKTVLSLAGIETPVRPCASGEFPSKAARPLYSVLSTEKFARATGFVFQDWKNALGKFMTRLKGEGTGP